METTEYRKIAEQYANTIGFNVGDECCHVFDNSELGKILYFSTEFTDDVLVDETTVYAFFDTGEAHSLGLLYHKDRILRNALSWWNDLSLQNHERPVNCRSGYVSKHYPQKDDCNDVTNAEIVYMFEQEHKVPVKVTDTATEQLKELSEKALALRLEQEAINFEVWVSGYENHNQAMKYFEVETMSELYAKFKQMTNGN